jgi:glucan phosphoethanolaminetransferase (alkaline phosphatase superfamily)
MPESTPAQTRQTRPPPSVRALRNALVACGQKSLRPACCIAGIALFSSVLVPLHSFGYKRLFLMSAAFYIITALLWRSKPGRVLSVILSLLCALNLTASLLCYIEYDMLSPVEFDLITNLFATDLGEALGMTRHHLQYIPILIVLCIALPALSWQTARLLSSVNIRRFAWIVATLILAAGMTQTIRHGLKAPQKMETYKSLHIPFIAADIINYTPLFNIGRIIDWYYIGNRIPAVRIGAERKDIQLTDNGINTFVVVIGESARRKNMSLYGYPRDTTPRENAERNRMLLFTNAVSPAAATLLSIPQSLCSMKGNAGVSPENWADNIINICNNAGLTTFFISNNNTSPGSGKQIGFVEIGAIVIGKFSRHFILGNRGPDGGLLARLDDALRVPGRKLIILHFIGSHEPFGARVPPEMKKFTGSVDDDYDDTLHYTDHVLGKLFDRLETLKASVLYFSDHGLVRSKRRNGAIYYAHAFKSNVKREAFEIPQWIWWSPAAQKAARPGTVDTLYCTRENYDLMLDWIGLGIPGHASASPLQKNYLPPPAGTVRVFTSSEDSVIYNELEGEDAAK